MKNKKGTEETDEDVRKSYPNRVKVFSCTYSVLCRWTLFIVTNAVALKSVYYTFCHFLKYLRS